MLSFKVRHARKGLYLATPCLSWLRLHVAVASDTRTGHVSLTPRENQAGIRYAGDLTSPAWRHDYMFEEQPPALARTAWRQAAIAWDCTAERRPNLGEPEQRNAHITAHLE